MFKASVVLCSLIPLLIAPFATAQKKGDSARVSIGIVERMQKVKLDANTGTGALLGGAAAWALARNQSSARQAAAATVGAGLGAASRESKHGGTAMQYTVRTGEGSSIQVVTDQTEIRIGDCVVVEESSNGANVRRSDPELCKTKSPEVLTEVADEMQEDADRCNTAKDRLIAATTSEQLDVARQVVEILCND